MTKQEFIEQYVLNRANTLDDALDGEGSAKIASNTYDQMIRLCDGESDLPSTALLNQVIDDMNYMIGQARELKEVTTEEYAYLVNRFREIRYKLIKIIEVNK